MPWWLLLLTICLTWCLWVLAALAEIAVGKAANKIPKDHGFSPMPVIPVFPLALFGLAKLVDVFVAPWGTVVMGAIHGLLALVFLTAIARSWYRLRSASHPE